MKKLYFFAVSVLATLSYSQASYAMTNAEYAASLYKNAQKDPRVAPPPRSAIPVTIPKKPHVSVPTTAPTSNTIKPKNDKLAMQRELVEMRFKKNN